MVFGFAFPSAVGLLYSRLRIGDRASLMSDLSLPLAFVVGLFSSLHCVGMCGGIVGALAFALPSEVRREPALLLGYLLLLNLGRVVSYSLAGALVGLWGEALLYALGGGSLRLWLQWTAALIVVLIGLNLAGWLPRLNRIERLGEPLWRRLEPIARNLLPIRRPGAAVIYGALWGWLPCGLVYTMLLGAATRSDALQGALYMAVFGLGTLAPVAATGFFAGRLHDLARLPFLKQAVGVIIAIIGLAALWFPEILGRAA